MKCPHCGYDNLKGVEKCGKCKKKLKPTKKSCPRCAFKNDIEDKKCQKCGYSFDKKPNIFLNAFISLIIVIILYSLLIFKKEDLISKVEYIFKIIAILTIAYIFISTLEFSNRNKKKLNDGLFISPEAKKIEIISKLMLLILGIMLLCISTYLYFKYIR
jgi:hypothetical protein